MGEFRVMVKIGVSMGTFNDDTGNSYKPPRSYPMEERFRIAKEMRVSGFEVGTKAVSGNFDELKELSRKYSIPILGGNHGITAYSKNTDPRAFEILAGKVKELGGGYMGSMIDDTYTIGQAIAQ